MALTLVGGCGGGGDATSGATADTSAPVVSTNLTGNGVPISDSAAIEIRFSESMDTATVDWGGVLSRESDGGVWSSRQSTNDTLTFHPATTWNLGTDRIIAITAGEDLAGNALVPITITVEVVAGTLYYVNVARADDTGDGLGPATAKRSIMAAVSAATAPASILVAGGTYDVTYPTDQIVMKEGVSLYGGFAGDFTARDATTYPSNVHDLSTGAGTNYLAPARAVEAGSGITGATRFDGFTVESGNTVNSGECAAAIYAYAGGAPVISNNLILGGTGERTNGIALYQSAPVIRGNTIYSGEGTSWSFGIFAISSSPRIENNLLTGGGTGTGSYGISFSGDAVIRNNTINGGSGGTYSIGIYMGQPSSNAAIDNNIVFTAGGFGRLCLSEGNDTAPGTVRNNDLFDCPTAFYVDTVTPGTGDCPFNNGQNCYTSIADVNDPAVTTQGTADTSRGNISVDQLFADLDGGDNDINTVADNDWHFAADGSSPCAVTTGGIDGSAEIPTWNFLVDHDSVARTAPWSIGAYEGDGSCS